MPDSGFRIKRLAEVVRHVRRPVVPQANRSYDLIGVRWYAEGTHHHDTIHGDQLQAPTLWSVKEGDLIYNKMWTSKGAFAVVTNETARLFGTSEYPTFEAVDGNLPEYFRFAFQNPRFWQQAEAWTNGTTERARLNPKDFLRLPVLLPEPPEQGATVHVLSTVEINIASTRLMANVVVSAKRAVMRELLTLGVRRGAASLVPLPARWVLGRVAENVTHIPHDWSLVTLTKVAKLESGHTPSREQPSYWGGEVLWLSLADTDALDALTVSETAEYVSQEGINNSSARILPADTVIFSRTATVGKATRLARPMATSQDFANWVCGPRLVPAYLVQVFRHMQREWLRLQEGSTHQTIYMPVFKKLQILLPPKAEQEKIAAMGEAFDRRLELERATLKALIANRDALAQELLSGRLRLPDSMIARYRSPPRAAA